MNKNTQKTLKLVETALLTAIVLLMAYTPLGYLKTAGLEITFIMIPVVVGAIVGGPSTGAFLGGVFGATSFIQCFGTSPFGATLLGINPVLTFIVCVPTRILAGFFAGLIAKAISKSGKLNISATVASLAGPLLNTAFFMSALVICFGQTEYIQGIMASLGATNVFTFIALFVGLQGLVEAGVCFVAASAVSMALQKALKRFKK
ncbi:MAG: ECF transporter S component [Clostridia bacterium]|nr:ECF transporter S component [Clostridia bacterium]